MVKGPPTNAGDMGSIPGWGRSPGGMATHSSILAWKIPWIEGPGGLQYRGRSSDVDGQSKRIQGMFKE